MVCVVRSAQCIEGACCLWRSSGLALRLALCLRAAPAATTRVYTSLISCIPGGSMAASCEWGIGRRCAARTACMYAVPAQEAVASNPGACAVSGKHVCPWHQGRVAAVDGSHCYHSLVWMAETGVRTRTYVGALPNSPTSGYYPASSAATTPHCSAYTTPQECRPDWRHA